MFGIFKNIFSTQGNTRIEELIKKDAFLVDVRSPLEYESGHVKGSINIPLDQIPQKLSLLKNKENIIVFCRSGNRSSQAKKMLEKLGFKNVENGGTWVEVNKMIKNK